MVVFRGPQNFSDLVQAPESLALCPNYTICGEEKDISVISKSLRSRSTRYTQKSLCENLAVVLYRPLQVRNPEALTLSGAPLAFLPTTEMMTRIVKVVIMMERVMSSKHLLCARHCF